MLRTTAEPGGPLWAGRLAGALIILLMGALVCLGIRERARRFRWLVWAWSVAYAGVFLALTAAAVAYRGGAMTIFGGFPAPTAWLVYGMGFFPLVLLAVLVYAFDVAFFDDRDQARFDRILRGEDPEDPATRPDGEISG